MNRFAVRLALVLCLLASTPLFAITRTWTGAVSGNWSVPANWSPAGTPGPADALVFPVGVANQTMTNDLPAGTSFGALTFNDVYTLSGNPLTLTGDVIGLVATADLKVGASVRLDSSTINGAVDINGQTLTAYGVSFHGAINGTGTIVVRDLIGGGITITGSGNFSGTIMGGPSGGNVSLGASCFLPNATVSLELVRQIDQGANATLGDLTITPSALGYVSGGHEGVLHTKSFALQGGVLSVFIESGRVSQIDATGTVTLAGSLGISLLGIPASGQSLTIIKNDGGAAVNGTFAGLPEGAHILQGDLTLTISYHGGGGNDVVLTNGIPNVKTWTGAASANWSNASNWSPAVSPVPGEPLLFPLGGANLAMTNDLPPGTVFGALTFHDAYTVSGNLLTLTGNVSGLTGNADLRIGSPLTFDTSATSGAVDINGQTLTASQVGFNGAINGTGTVISQGPLDSLIVSGGGNFSGTIRGDNSGGSLILGTGAALPNATVAIGLVQQVTKNATVGDLTITPSAAGYVSPGAGGVLHTKSLVLQGGFSVFMQSTDASQIDVTGTVTLAGPLGITLLSPPAGGQSFVIISNDGTDPVMGTFAGLLEGAIAAAGSSRFRISYVGGDGNDVVLMALIDTTTAATQNANATQFGEPLTLTATMVAQSGTPAGSVLFTADGATIGTVPVQNGVAALMVTTLNSGTHAFVATFRGTGVFADSVSGSIAHVVNHGQTKTSIVADKAGMLYGQTVHFTVTVGVQAPAAGQPTGSVTILADGVPLGTTTVINGTATFDTAALDAGMRSITATYGGDANFDGSTASAIQQNVGKAQTVVDARPRTPLFVGESPFITVFVNVTPGSAIVPTGAVSISEGAAVLGTQPLLGGVASITLNPMAMGDHTLLVSYGGDTDFEASSATIIQSVVVPAVSILGTRVLEGNRGVTSVSLVATLSSPISQTVRVSFSTIAGSATEGEDYEKASGVIEFAPGQVTSAIELHIFGDTFPEADETFSVLLSDPVNATIDTPSAVVVIVNDDQIPPRRRPSRH